MTLREQAISGVKWSGVSATAAAVLQFLQIVILSWLLNPEDFGLMAMIMVVIGFSEAFGDLGISNAIIYRQECTRDELSTLYWLNILTGAAIFLILWLITPVAVYFFNENKLRILLPLTASTFLIMAIGKQFQVLLQKNLQFNRLSIIEVLSAVVGSGIAIFLAFLGNGVFSLIFGQIAKVTATVLFAGWLCLPAWRPRFHFRTADLRGYLGFGLYQMGERGINFLSSNVDYIMVGRYLGSEILGIYRIAYELVVAPLVRVNPIIVRVAFPVFSKKQFDNTALRHGYSEMIKLISTIAFPVMLGVGVTASLFIPVLFGEKWLEAIPLIQILVPLGLFKMLSNPSGTVLLAKGRVEIGFLWNIFVALGNTLSFWWATQHGIQYLAWTYAVLSLIQFVVISEAIVYRLIGFGLMDYIRVAFKPAVLSMIMALMVYVVYRIGVELSINQTPLLCGIVTAGIGIYVGMLMFTEREYLNSIWRAITTR